MADEPRIYAKPALNEDDLLERWKSKGLEIPDASRALRYLRHIGYFRLSAYVRSFETGERDVLREGTSFDDVISLYVFDRKLRLLCLDALERIEVALRASISDHMAQIAGPHWFEDSRCFQNAGEQRKLLASVDEFLRMQGSRRSEYHLGGDRFVSALDHYVMTYDTPKRPPTWIVFEEVSFGVTRSVFEGLRDHTARLAIAKSLGLTKPVLSSWLKSFQRIRNICAHHGRLWNRGLGVYPMLPKSPGILWLSDPTVLWVEPWRRQRLYPVLVALQTILYTISPRSNWRFRLRTLLEPRDTQILTGMGVPQHWFVDSFWSGQIENLDDEQLDTPE